MNKLEERHAQIRYDFNDEIPIAHASITKEWSIGFLGWVKGNYEPAYSGWWSYKDLTMYSSDELFEMYLNTLK
ncbi:MAG TPA: hypothetical protein PL167_07565 [Cyclobacteriaceae bacterium]|nr:hypothetical protein [Cyclobacteriaceae bacterium]